MKNRTSGFTLVELMVVMLLVGLLVLITTQIPLFGLSSWTKGSERLKMQRDANLVMIRIQHELRPAEDSLVSPSTKGSEVDKLDIDGVLFYVEKDETSGLFDFVQKSGEKEEKVVKGYSDMTFQVAVPNSNVREITLTLVKENVATIILRTAVKPRN